MIIYPDNIKRCCECGQEIFCRPDSAPICDRCFELRE